MKNKAFLPLTEQILMVLFFALAAAICLRGFSLASEISYNGDTLDLAVASAQNTAEVLKLTKGDFQKAADILNGTNKEGSIYISYAEDGTAVTDPDLKHRFYIVVTKKQTDNPYLSGADILAKNDDGTIFELTVNWQNGGLYE